MVPRFTDITVPALDRNGKKIELLAEEFRRARRAARDRSPRRRAVLRSHDVDAVAHVSRRIFALSLEGRGLISLLDSGAPVVTLRTAPTTPYDGAIAAARTCYSPRVIGANEVTDKQRDSIGPLTFDAGHHTVFQHAHFEFGLENISRQFVWTFLHSYPFYNSEQSSQRYVKLNEPRAFVPPLSGEARDVYEAAVVRAWDRYAELSALLKDDALAILKELRYVRPTTNPGAAEADREGRREAGDRDRALRDPDRRVHLDGAHRLGHRPAPPAPDDEHGRRAVRGAPRHRARWCGW